MDDHPQPAPLGDVPSPAVPGDAPGRVRFARSVVQTVNAAPWWLTLLVWLLLFWLLLPLLIVWRTNGSRFGMGAATAVLLVFVAAGVSAEPVDPADEPAAAAGEAAADPADGPVASPSPHRASPPAAAPSASPTPSPSPAPSPSPSPSPSPTEQLASAGPRGDDAPVVAQGRVQDIVDGDTIDLSDGTRVRLAIADTPEIHFGIEPCGPEASDFTGSFLAGETVAVYRPDDAPSRDGYDRVLGEVVRVTDGASLNVALVRAGLATVDLRFVGEDRDLAARLAAAASEATDPGCAPQQDPEPAPEQEPEPPQDAGEGGAGAGQHTGRVDGGWSCHPAYLECLPQVGDLNCGDVGHSVTVPDPSNDPYRLDGNDNDGRGCESNGAWSPSSTYPYY